MLKLVILSYNHPKITVQTLNSAKKYFSDEDIFLIHNGSEQNHVDFLKDQFPQIQHIQMLVNKGYSGGANEGLRQAFEKSPWVIFLTNDCELLSRPTPPQYPALIAAKIYWRKTQRIDSAGAWFWPRRAKLEHCKNPELFNNKIKSWGRYPYVSGTAFMMHKEIFNTIKGFDERLGTYWEDVDFSMKAAKLKYPLTVDEGFEVRHGVGKTCHKNSLYTTYFFQRNRLIISRRYTKLRWYWLLWLRLHWVWAKTAVNHWRHGRTRELNYLKKIVFDN